MRNLPTWVKIVAIVAGCFFFLTTLCCGFGLFLSLFVDDETRQAIRDRQEARRLADEAAKTPLVGDKEHSQEIMPEGSDDVPKTKPFVMPSYTVLETVNRIDGSKQIEVLVPGYDPSTSIEFRAKAGEQIAKKEQADIVVLFATKDAQKAAYSDSFKQQNPNAAKGYLGRWADGGFEAGGD